MVKPAGIVPAKCSLVGEYPTYTISLRPGIVGALGLCRIGNCMHSPSATPPPPRALKQDVIYLLKKKS